MPFPGDNPFFEAAFKTLKYCPAFPARFGCIADVRDFCGEFFAYYIHEHRTSGSASTRGVGPLRDGTGDP